MQLHHAGIDKTDDHNGRRRRGLDHGCNHSPEQNALERCLGHLVKKRFQLVPGCIFQSVTHLGHTEEEQGYPAKKRQYHRNHFQNHIPLLILMGCSR